MTSTRAWALHRNSKNCKKFRNFFMLFFRVLIYKRSGIFKYINVKNRVYWRTIYTRECTVRGRQDVIERCLLWQCQFLYNSFWWIFVGTLCINSKEKYVFCSWNGSRSFLNDQRWYEKSAKFKRRIVWNVLRSIFLRWEGLNVTRAFLNH